MSGYDPRVFLDGVDVSCDVLDTTLAVTRVLAEAGTARFTLTSTSGRYTVGHPACVIARGSTVTVDALADGVRTTRFTGRVETATSDVAQSAERGGDDPVTVISAADRWARLARITQRVAVQQALPADAVVWPLATLTDTVAFAVRTSMSLTPGEPDVRWTSVPDRTTPDSIDVEGVGPLTDDLAAVRLLTAAASRTEGRVDITRRLDEFGTSGGTISVWVNPTEVPATTTFPMVLLVVEDYLANYQLIVNRDPETAAGAINLISQVTGTGETSRTRIATLDSRLHLLTLTTTPTSTLVYWDGRLVATVPQPIRLLRALTLGLRAFSAPTAATFSTLAVSSTVMTPTSVADMWQAGTTGYAGQTVDQRLRTLATLAGLPLSDLRLDASRITCAAQALGGNTVQMMSETAATDPGWLFVTRHGLLRYRRTDPNDQVAPVTTLDACELLPDARLELATDTATSSVTVDSPVGQFTARAPGADPLIRNDVTITTVHDNPAQAARTAASLAQVSVSPPPSFPTVRTHVDLLATDSDWSTLELGDVVLVDLTASQLPALAGRPVVLVGYTEQITDTLWSVDADLTPPVRAVNLARTYTAVLTANATYSQVRTVHDTYAEVLTGKQAP